MRCSAPLECAADLRIVFAHVRLSRPALARLAAALAEIDREDSPKRELVKMRASFIDSERDARQDVLLRPWRTHVMNRTLAGYAEMIRASNRPWPDRIDAIVAGRLRAVVVYGAPPACGLIRSIVEAQAERLALVRAGRALVAVEQVRTRTRRSAANVGRCARPRVSRRSAGGSVFRPSDAPADRRKQLHRLQRGTKQAR